MFLPNVEAWVLRLEAWLLHEEAWPPIDEAWPRARETREPKLEVRVGTSGPAPCIHSPIIEGHILFTRIGGQE